MTYHTLEVKYDKKTDNYFLEFPNGILENLGWSVGDMIEWSENKDGTFSVKKICSETITKGAISSHTVDVAL